MSFINRTTDKGMTTLELDRGKVKASNETLLDELAEEMEALKSDDGTDSIIITGEGKFFSFGFDIPEFYPYSRVDFTKYISKFIGLLTDIFLYPKPVIAALNGHTIAGGCMIALACDQRIMTEGKGKIALNELSFGATLLAGPVEMLRFATGSRRAAKILLSAEMYSPDKALEVNLIDAVVPEGKLMECAQEEALQMGSQSQRGFQAVKGLLKRPVVDQYGEREKDSLSDFIDIWYSDPVRANLKKITID